jgi:hypothetical protein
MMVERFMATDRAFAKVAPERKRLIGPPRDLAAGRCRLVY